MRTTGIYLLSIIFYLSAAILIFRIVVRRDYLNKGHLSLISSFLQLIIFFALLCFPYLFNPPQWPWFRRIGTAPVTINKISGMILIVIGFMIAFGTMFWFGLPRAFEGTKFPAIFLYKQPQDIQSLCE